jgi:hypothetical protein
MSQANPKKSRPTGALAAHRARLREEAEARNEAHAALSIEERLRKAHERPGNSAREISRLRKQLAAREKAGVTKQKKGQRTPRA